MLNIIIIIPILLSMLIFIVVLWFLLLQNKMISRTIVSEKNKFIPYKEKLKRLYANPESFEEFNKLVRDFLKERFKMEYNLTYLEIAENFKQTIGKKEKFTDQEEWEDNLEEISKLLKYGREKLRSPEKNTKKEIDYVNICLEEAYRRLKNLFNKISFSFFKEDKEGLEKFVIEIQDRVKGGEDTSPYDLLDIINRGMKILKRIKTPEEMVNFCNLMNHLVYSGEKTSSKIKRAMELFSNILNKYG